MLGKWFFGRFLWKTIFYTINEAHKQYSILDTLFNYIFYFGPPRKHLCKSQENLLRVVSLHCDVDELRMYHQGEYFLYRVLVSKLGHSFYGFSENVNLARGLSSIYNAYIYIYIHCLFLFCQCFPVIVLLCHTASRTRKRFMRCVFI